MTYADFEYYSGTYMGAVSENDFPRLVVRASSFLDYYTRNRAQDNADLDAVKMCCCALVDKYAVIEAAQALAMKNLTNAAAKDGRQLVQNTCNGRRIRPVCTQCDGRGKETAGGNVHGIPCPYRAAVSRRWL